MNIKSVEKFILGIDIGTTTISASVVNTQTQKQIQAYTVANQSFINRKETFSKEQDADIILSTVEKLLTEILSAYPNISKIGVTGQMHGILYVDKNGRAVSPLFTWQDGRAGLLFKQGRTYVQEIEFLTGQAISVGYGLATHYYNSENRLVPEDSVKFSTIMDYITMRLCNKMEPKIHATNAASLGLFDIEKGNFDFVAIKKLGINKNFFPCVVETNYEIGTYKNIPVYVAIGDNQASFFGSVSNGANSVLVNYGTGSQVSFLQENRADIDGFEIRPYRDGLYLYSGAAICGGRAYAILEKFFSDYLLACGVSNGKQYEIMNALAEKAYMNEPNLIMETTFCGTRNNPDKTGGLYNVREKNFTPENVIYATLKGMAQELFDMFDKVDKSAFNRLIASGNAVRLNPTFQSILSRVFKMPLYIPTVSEEAAYGTALWINSNKEKNIEYQEGKIIEWRS